MNIAVVDLGTSNIRSLTSALTFLGAPHTVTSDPAAVDSATHVILPGVGAFDAAMKRLAELSMVDGLRRHALEKKRPLLGVCLGMQLLFDGSDEGTRPGTAIVPGTFRRLSADSTARRKVPHVGFSAIYGYRATSLFRGFGPEASFYFTHSFALPSLNGGANVALCDHAAPFVAAFQNENICGAQFHPEKSQSSGLRLLANFLELA